MTIGLNPIYTSNLRIVYLCYILNLTIVNSVRGGLVYSQMLRYRRITTEDQIFFKRGHHLRVILLGRGYRDTDILLAMGKAYSFTQSQLLVPKTDADSPILPFVSPFDYNLSHLGSLPRQNWLYIENDQCHFQIFQSPPILSFQRNPNFKDHVVRSRFK